jgi:hypothetical protein
LTSISKTGHGTLLISRVVQGSGFSRLDRTKAGRLSGFSGTCSRTKRRGSTASMSSMSPPIPPGLTTTLRSRAPMVRSIRSWDGHRRCCDSFVLNTTTRFTCTDRTRRDLHGAFRPGHDQRFRCHNDPAFASRAELLDGNCRGGRAGSPFVPRPCSIAPRASPSRGRVLRIDSPTPQLTRLSRVFGSSIWPSTSCDCGTWSLVVRSMADGVRCPSCGSITAVHATRVVSADGPFLNCRCDRCERDWK